MSEFTFQDRVSYLDSMQKITDEMTQAELEELAMQVTDAELGIAASIGAI